VAAGQELPPAPLDDPGPPGVPQLGAQHPRPPPLPPVQSGRVSSIPPVLIGHASQGIEATTGPLGQGVVNAAGIAAAQKMEQAMFNTKDHTIFDSVTISLCGDGCLQVRAASRPEEGTRRVQLVRKEGTRRVQCLRLRRPCAPRGGPISGRFAAADARCVGWQEGVSAEGASFAAHEGLDNLIIVYDSNDVTLDKMAGAAPLLFVR
jgi:hypothetical protein